MAVFSDNGGDFMLQEATISGQGEVIWLLALASADSAAPIGIRGVRPGAAVELRDLGGRRLASRMADADGTLDWRIEAARCLIAVSSGRPALRLAP